MDRETHDAAARDPKGWRRSNEVGSAFSKVAERNSRRDPKESVLVPHARTFAQFSASVSREKSSASDPPGVLSGTFSHSN